MEGTTLGHTPGEMSRGGRTTISFSTSVAPGIPPTTSPATCRSSSRSTLPLIGRLTVPADQSQFEGPWSLGFLESGLRPSGDAAVLDLPAEGPWSAGSARS